MQLVAGMVLVALAAMVVTAKFSKLLRAKDQAMRFTLYGLVLLLSLPGASHAEPQRIVLVGDSTVTDASGWGLGFASLFGPEAKVINMAQSGRSSKSFRDEGHWQKVLDLKPQWVLIQFGHNDQPGKGPARETDPKSTFPENMMRFVDEASAIGAKIILITSMERRQFDGNGKIRPSLTDYANATRQAAEKKMVPLVDLNTRSIEWLNKAGPEGSLYLDPPPDKTGKKDKTHLTRKGADAMGGLVVEEIRKVAPELAKLLK